MKPNVLLIITDQQRADTLGFRKLTPCRTPHIDRIAREGVSFNKAITPCPLCLPSRASLFTGLYPVQNDMMDNTTSSLTDCALLTHFKDHGYQINYAGKWHLGEKNIDQFVDRHAGDSTAVYSQWCREQGLIDGWAFNDARTRTNRTPSMSTPVAIKQDLPTNKTNDAYISDIASDMIRSRHSEHPFFQVCSFNGPHPPFVIPEEYYSLYDPQSVIEPPNFGVQRNEPPSNQTSYYRQLFEDHGSDFNAWRKSYAVYWGFVTMIDGLIGKLLATLEYENVLDDTVIVFVSDHGENLGAHGLWHKMVGYRESIEVPMIFKLPSSLRCTRGESTDTPASLIDVAATLAALCGLPPMSKIQGANMANFVYDPGSLGTERDVFSMHQPLGDWMGTTDWRMIQSGTLKYIWHRDGNEELYDLHADPFETNNLGADRAKANKIKPLQQKLIEFMTSICDPVLKEWPSARQ